MYLNQASLSGIAKIKYWYIFGGYFIIGTFEMKAAHLRSYSNLPKKNKKNPVKNKYRGCFWPLEVNWD